MVDLLRTIKNALDAHGALIFGGAVAAGLVARRAALKRSSFDADWSYVTCFGCGRGGYSDEMASTTDDSGKDHYSCARCARPDLFRQAEDDESDVDNEIEGMFLKMQFGMMINLPAVGSRWRQRMWLRGPYDWKKDDYGPGRYAPNRMTNNVIEIISVVKFKDSEGEEAIVLVYIVREASGRNRNGYRKYRVDDISWMTPEALDAGGWREEPDSVGMDAEDDDYDYIECEGCSNTISVHDMLETAGWSRDGHCDACVEEREAEGAEGTNPGKWFFLSSYDYLWLEVIPHEAMEPNHGSVKLEREDFQEPDDADFFDIDQVYFDRDWFQHYYGHDRIFDPISGDEFRIGAPGAHIEDYGPIVPMLIRVTDPNTIQILVDGGCKAFDNPPQTKADWSMGDGVVEIDGVAYSISDDNYAAEEDSNNPCPHCEGAAGFPREFYYQSDRIDMVPCGTCLTQGRCPGCMEIYADLTRDNTPEDVFYGSGCTSCGYSESDAREARKTARRWVDLIDNPAATRFMDAEDYGVGSVWMAERYDPAKHAKPLPIGSVRRFLSTIPQRQHFRIEFVKSSGHIRSMDAILTKPFAGGDVASVLEIFPGSEKSSVFKRFRLDRVISIYRV